MTTNIDSENNINSENIWNISGEFSNLVYDYINLDDEFITYINKWLNVSLLRDNEYFKNILTDDLYNEYISKIKIYCDTNGYTCYKCPLYFVVYNFSEELQNIILNERNKLGLYLHTMLVLPFETFSNNTNIMNLAKNIKKLSNIINLKELLQEITFDMGCSSYAVGKLYDCINKIINNMELSQQTKKYNIINDYEFNNINNIIFNKLSTHIDLIKNIIKYSTEDEIEIEKIKNKMLQNYPLGYSMKNKYFINLSLHKFF
jgi:hypothetical protein